MGKSREFKTAIAASITGLLTIAGLLCVLGLAENRSHSERVLGVMYHQVLKDQSRLGKYVISPNELEQDFQYLKSEGYTSMLPREIAEYHSAGKPLPEKTAVITFDDGYETGLSYVLPLLEKYDFKAVINIVGAYTDEYTALPKEQKSLSYDYLDWDEVRQLSDSGRVEIGCHTYNLHENGERLGCSKKAGESTEQYKAMLESDITRFQQKLQQELGYTATCFAYPYGAISDASGEVLSGCGMRVYLTCAEKPSVIDGEPIVINRYNRPSGMPLSQIFADISQSEM